MESQPHWINPVNKVSGGMRLSPNSGCNIPALYLSQALLTLPVISLENEFLVSFDFLGSNLIERTSLRMLFSVSIDHRTPTMEIVFSNGNPKTPLMGTLTLNDLDSKKHSF